MLEKTSTDIKYEKLKKMRLIATGLLLLMVIVYAVFKRFEDTNYLFSCIVAFSEASMIGALADWFAVVALFRYPLGQKWIPHVAIIPNNKERIGNSISDFVVTNFFSEDAIKIKLENIEITEEFINYFSQNREKIIDSFVKAFPGILNYVFDDLKLETFIKDNINKKLEDQKLYPLLGRFTEVLVSSGHHRPIIKELLVSIYHYIEDNKDGTLNFLGNLNKTLSLPVVGDIVYRNILKILLKQIDSIENNSDSDINSLLIYSLPKLIENLKTSEVLIEKGEALKVEILESETYQGYLSALLNEAKSFLVLYGQNNEDTLRDKASKFIDFVISKALSVDDIKDRLDLFLKKVIVKVIVKYKFEIKSLIDDTIGNWEGKDMADRLEVQVGADLQYIRINGTVIGGLAGLAIHLITTAF